MEWQPPSGPASGQSAGTNLVFRNQVKIGRNVILALISGGFFILFTFLHFFFVILLPGTAGGASAGATGALTMIGVMSLGYAAMLLRSPVRVTLNPDGMLVEWLINRKIVNWRDIAKLRRRKATRFFSTTFLGRRGQDIQREVLDMLDEKGKKILELDNILENFAVLAAEIERRSAEARGVSTYNRDEQIKQMLKSQKRSALRTAVMGAILALFGGFCGYMVWSEHHAEEVFNRNSRIIMADIINHHEDRAMYLLEYQFTDETGQAHTREAHMERKAWKNLEGDEQVAIRYLPASPEESRLTAGERKSSPPSFLLTIASVLIIFLGVLLLIGYFLGYADLKIEKGKWKLVRIGDVDDAFEPAIQSTRSAMVSAPSPTIFLPPEAPGRFEQSSMVEAPVGVQPKPGVTKAEKAPVPAGIKAIAILNLVFGIIGMGMGGFKMVMLLFIGLGGGADFGEGLVFQMTGLEMVFAGAEHIFTFILAALLTISAYGIYRLRPWGRYLALTVVILQILQGILDISSIIWMQTDMGNVSQETQLIYWFGIGVAIFLTALGLLYPAIALFVLLRRPVRKMFARGTAAGLEQRELDVKVSV